MSTSGEVKAPDHPSVNEHTSTCPWVGSVKWVKASEVLGMTLYSDILFMI